MCLNPRYHPWGLLHARSFKSSKDAPAYPYKIRRRLTNKIAKHMQFFKVEQPFPEELYPSDDSNNPRAYWDGILLHECLNGESKQYRQLFAKHGDKKLEDFVRELVRSKYGKSRGSFFVDMVTMSLVRNRTLGQIMLFAGRTPVCGENPKRPGDRFEAEFFALYRLSCSPGNTVVIEDYVKRVFGQMLEVAEQEYDRCMVGHIKPTAIFRKCSSRNDSDQFGLTERPAPSQANGKHESYECVHKATAHEIRRAHAKWVQRRGPPSLVKRQAERVLGRQG